MLGEISRGKITDENQDSYFVQINGKTYELPKIEITQEEHPKLGDEVQGFIYENLHKKAKMTQFLPFAQKDQYGWAKVTQIRGDLGVFVDIGLQDKEIVVSLDDLPYDKARWPKKGDRLLVRLETDEKERIWAKLADDDVFQQLSSRFPSDLINKDLKVTVYASRLVGAFAISDEYYLTFIHESQMAQPLRLGQTIEARVIGISQYSRLNLSTLPRAFEEIDDDAQMILMSLARTPDHTLPFSDKSDPSEIKNHFGISKGAFKRALGHLLKADYISENKIDNTIHLLKLPGADSTHDQ